MNSDFNLNLISLTAPTNYFDFNNLYNIQLFMYKQKYYFNRQTISIDKFLINKL